MSHPRIADIAFMKTPLSRRGLVSVSAGTVGAISFTRPSSAQEASPAASVDIEAFRSLCQVVVGVEDLADDSLEQLLGLMLDDGESAAGLEELLGAGEDDVIEGFPSPAGFTARTNILQFWYLGEFNGAPIDNRADRFAGLISYEALPYSTIPAVCKRHGYWAEELGLPDRS